MAGPVNAITPRKKNNQRGPTVGTVLCMIRNSPPQPKIVSTNESGKKERRNF
jgi:hypothetical protein